MLRGQRRVFTAAGGWEFGSKGRNFSYRAGLRGLFKRSCLGLLDSVGNEYDCTVGGKGSVLKA